MISRINVRLTLAVAAAVIIGCGVVGDAMAQSEGGGFGQSALNALKNRNSAGYFSASQVARRDVARGVTQAGVIGVNRKTFFSPNFLSSGPSRPAAKPFSSVSRGSTLSPYLALNNSLNSADSYYNLVRPQQEQRRRDAQAQRQSRANQQRIGQYTAAAPFSPQGNDELAPTGHAAVFGSLGSYLTTGSYYPPPSAGKR